MQEPVKPIIEPTTDTEIIMDHGSFRVGDIVSLTEKHKYFCQIRGFHRDQFSGKYASIYWLLPNSTGISLNKIISNGMFSPYLFDRGFHSLN